MILTTPQAIAALEAHGAGSRSDSIFDALCTLQFGCDRHGSPFSSDDNARQAAVSLLRDAAPSEPSSPDWWVWDVIFGLEAKEPAETEGGMFVNADSRWGNLV